MGIDPVTDVPDWSSAAGQDPDLGWPPREFDTGIPHSARMYDYWLGGKDNFAVDRAAGDAWLATFPGMRDVARASRSFLTRSIAYLAGDAGIRQFLDVGTGLPTADNTHQVAQRIAPETRIVYVDNDPLVLAHARALLTSTPQGATAYIYADLRDPEKILAEAADTLDFSKPIALILSGVLGHVVDIGQARSIVRDLLAGLPSGSYLSLNDGTSVIGREQLDQATQDYNDSGAVPYVQRTPEEIASFFEGLELVEPGVVPVPHWRPDPDAEQVEIYSYCGVGRKP